MYRYLALQKILELGSFTKAAKALGYTQSSISQMIASLENELSFKLLTRSRSGVHLTLEGQQLYPFIQRSISQYRTMIEKSQEIRGLETGTVRFGTFSSVTNHWLPKLIAGFLVEHPNVQFEFYQGHYGSILDRIHAGIGDFGFVTRAATANLETIPLKNGAMLAVLPLDHPLAKEPVIHLKDMVDEPLILLDEGPYSMALDAFQSAGLEPNIRYTIDDDHGAMTMVEAGLGFSIISELMLRRQNYRIACIPTDPPITRELAIGFVDKASLPIASKYFIQHIVDHIDELP